MADTQFTLPLTDKLQRETDRQTPHLSQICISYTLFITMQILKSRLVFPRYLRPQAIDLLTRVSYQIFTVFSITLLQIKTAKVFYPTYLSAKSVSLIKSVGIFTSKCIYICFVHSLPAVDFSLSCSLCDFSQNSCIQLSTLHKRFAWKFWCF